jgi:membrane protein
MIYKILPRVRIGWRDVWVGAAVTALLFSLGKSLIGLYLGRSGAASGFGAAGSLILVIVWTYYSAQIFLLGAEFTHVYAHARGSRCPDAVATSADGHGDPTSRLARSRDAIAAAMSSRKGR